MAAILFWNGDRAAQESRLNSIIEVENEDNLKTHFRQIVLFKDDGKISGVIYPDRFKIWIQKQGRSGVTGIFYPIIEAQMRYSHRGIAVAFSSKMNIIGRFFCFIGGTVLVYGIATGIVIQENNEMRFIIPRLLAGALLFLLASLVPAAIYFRTSRIVKTHVIRELGLEAHLVRP